MSYEPQLIVPESNGISKGILGKSVLFDPFKTLNSIPNQDGTQAGTWLHSTTSELQFLIIKAVKRSIVLN
jgi:hypothetical protein